MIKPVLNATLSPVLQSVMVDGRGSPQPVARFAFGVGETLVDTNRLSVWSGNGPTATQATADARPTKESTFYAFLGTDDQMAVSPTIALTGSWVLFAVLLKQTATTDAFYCTDGISQSIRSFNATSFAVTTSAGAKSFTQGAMGNGTPYLYTIVATPASMIAYRNGVSLGTVAGDAGNLSISAIGRHSTFFREHGQIWWEAYNQSLTAAQITAANSRIATACGITL
jgi:hypothetical protein